MPRIPWGGSEGSSRPDRVTVFMMTEAWDAYQEYYKKVWACPMCGELHISLAEPPFCHDCKFKRPSLSSDEYDEVAKRVRQKAAQRILKRLGG